MDKVDVPTAVLLNRSLFMAGQLDTTGTTVNEIMSKPLVGNTTPQNIDERTRWAVGRVGELIGEEEGNLVAVKPGPVKLTVSKIP